jgi:membrane fusion protein, multidrug efflux system
LPRMQKGAALPVEALDRDGKTRLASGKLASIDNQIDLATGTVKLKAEFANADGRLFPNQFINVRLKIATLPGVTLIPGAAVQRGAPGTYVYKVNADNTVAVQPVRLGPVNGNAVAVESGLQPGDRVVVDGADQLRQGSAVEVIADNEGGGAAGGAAGRRGRGAGAAAAGAAAGAPTAGAPTAEAPTSEAPAAAAGAPPAAAQGQPQAQGGKRRSKGGAPPPAADSGAPGARARMPE